jgi:hypothetical protein
MHDFEVKQEEDRVDSKSIVHVGVVSLVIGAIGVFFAGVIQVATLGVLRPNLAGPRGPLPAPREISGIEQTPLLASPAGRVSGAGIETRQAQARALSSWGWADRDAGIATIPIERAMDIIARESQ